MVMGLVSGLSLANHSDSRVLLGGARLVQPKWMPDRRILGGGRTCGVSFWPFPNSSGWWRLISSLFFTRTSCRKTTHANGYYGAWPGWAVSISVLPLTVLPAHRSILTFWGMCEQKSSTVATSSSILPSKIQGSSVSTFSHHLLILCTLVIFCCFWSLHWSYLRCEIVSHCGFNLHFSSDKPC